MSVRVTAVVMRRGVRMCRCLSLWQQRSFLTPIWGSNQSPACPAKSHVAPVTFHSQSGIHGETEHPSPPPTEIQAGETASDQKHGRSSLRDHLQRCSSPSDVLDLTCGHALTPWQVSTCLKCMWFTAKKMSNVQRHYELQLMFKHPAFEKLLQTAMLNSGYMHIEDIAYSFMCVVKLGVPQRSRVVQYFLRICQDRLNDFDEKCLSILASCLADMEDTQNVAALKEGMRLVVDARLPKIQTVVSLQTMMRVLGKDAPVELKKKMEKKALLMTDQFSLPNTHYMICTMAAMGFSSKPLLDICSKKIIENIHCIPFNRLLPVLYACQELRYRDFELLTDISDYVATLIDVWSNKQFIILLSVFEKLAFCPDAIMEAFAEKVITNPEALTLKSLLCILKVYSSLNYDLQQRRQQFLDSLSQALDSFLPKMSVFELLKTVYYFSQMGHFSPAALQQLLQSSTLEQLKAAEPRFLCYQEQMFQTIDLCLRIDRPQLPLPLTVPPFVLGEPAPSSPQANLWLSQSLRSVLEDRADTTLQERVVEENFYFIDAVITKPLTTQTSETSSLAGEASSPAESSQRIAVICTPHSFCYGTSNPRGILAVKIRHLKILGYDHVLVVDQSMSERKRMDFLRRHIFPEHHESDSQPELEPLGS